MQLGTITIQAPMQPFLSAEEVGKLLGVSGRTVERMAKDGQFPPAMKVGGYPRFTNVAVGLYLLWCQIGPPPPAPPARVKTEQPEE